MPRTRFYFTNQPQGHRLFNEWDIIALLLIFSVLVLLGWTAMQMGTPYELGKSIPISLDPKNLPMYAARTTLRMFIALLFSLVFTFTIGTWAAKNSKAEKIIVPMIDVLQSVPVLSFLSITVVVFIRLFPGSLLGPECASIFAIFTAQAWNMTLGFYQTVRNIPHDLREVADIFHLSAWQRFWRIEVPFSMPSLLWNMMMSLSASWFFVVASEAISVSNQDIRLPGIGSYIKLAIDNANVKGVAYAIFAMFTVILIYDQLVFRPLIKISERFHTDEIPSEQSAYSWVINLLHRTLLLKYFSEVLDILTDKFINFKIIKHHKKLLLTHSSEKWTTFTKWFLHSILFLALFIPGFILIRFITSEITFSEIKHVLFLGSITSLRVMILIILSSIVWVPIGVWIGCKPNIARNIQPIIQFLAAFPANLFFPIFAVTIMRYHLNIEIWTTPLMILGSQWYILFNVIAGASTLPKDLYQAADNLNVKGWLWWRRLALPAIFPYYVTGAITAAGGAWNASIVAEWIEWGNSTLTATGLGAYIATYTKIGDFPRIALGTSIMCIFVLTFNRLIWRPLYRFAERRFSL